MFKFFSRVTEQNMGGMGLIWGLLEIAFLLLSPLQKIVSHSVAFIQQSKKEMVFTVSYNLCGTKIDQAC